jgi:hypothetical protein
MASPTQGRGVPDLPVSVISPLPSMESPPAIAAAASTVNWPATKVAEFSFDEPREPSSLAAGYLSVPLARTSTTKSQVEKVVQVAQIKNQIWPSVPAKHFEATESPTRAVITETPAQMTHPLPQDAATDFADVSKIPAAFAAVSGPDPRSARYRRSASTSASNSNIMPAAMLAEPEPGSVLVANSSDAVAAAPQNQQPAFGGVGLPAVLRSADSFVLAAQPELGANGTHHPPLVDPCASPMPPILSDFSPDAIDPNLPYDPGSQMGIYQGKTLNATQRPLLELGRPWYQLGQLSPGSSILGQHNNLVPQLLVYGDFRSAIASNHQGGNGTTLSALELNLDFDLQLTATERFHWFMSPLDNGQNNTGYVFDEDRFATQVDGQLDFGYFEGDLGALVGGATNKTLPFDFPFAIGVMPLLMQNGIWMEDAFLGVAATIPARNSAALNISNMDTTFFAGFDKISSPAFINDDSAAKMIGSASFIEALNGYIELDYAFLDDRCLHASLRTSVFQFDARDH